MRKIYIILNFILVVAVISGCERVRLREQLKDLMSSTIVLPQKITCVQNGEVFPMPDSIRNKSKLLVYIDSTECVTCRVSHLWEYSDLFELSENTSAFDLMLLLSDTTFVSIPLTRYLVDLDFPFPVYVDEDRRFLKENPQIPADTRMHSFYLDETGIPQFVGDPVMSDKLLSVFKLAIAHQGETTTEIN